MTSRNATLLDGALTKLFRRRRRRDCRASAVRKLTRGLSVGAIACTIVTAISPSAWASSACEPYVPRYTYLNAKTDIWAGNEGELSVPGTYLPVGASNSILINYFDAVTANNNANCPGAIYPPICQIQGGWGEGNVFYATSSTPSLYVEKQDVYGYIAIFWTSVNIGLSDYYRVEFTGQTKNVNGIAVGLFAAYYDNHTGYGLQDFGEAWLPYYYSAQVQDVLEVNATIHGYCPIVYPYENWGYNYGGPVNWSTSGQRSGYQPVTYSYGNFYVDPAYPAYLFHAGDPSSWYVSGG